MQPMPVLTPGEVSFVLSGLIVPGALRARHYCDA